MVSQHSRQISHGQAAIEYLILLALVILIALIAFNRFLPRTQQQANRYFDDASRRIYGDLPEDGKSRSEAWKSVTGGYP